VRRLEVEALEDRLVPSWAGVPPASIVPPASYTAVTLDAAGDARGSAAITADETDYYSFIAPAAGNYRFSALTPASDLDPVLGVFGADGSRLAHNDDIVTYLETDSDLTVALQAGRRYYFGITNYTGSGGGGYDWRVDGPALPTDDRFENNDTFASATNLGKLTAPQTVTGLVLQDADWFYFRTVRTGGSGHYVRIAFDHSLGDLDLALYNSAGRLVRASTSVTNSEQISLGGLAAGNYFVRIYGYRGATNPSYRLIVRPPGSATPSPTPTPTSAFNIELSINGLTTAQRAIFERAATRWEQVIVGDLPNASYGGRIVDDLLIGVRSVAIDGPGGVLGQAGPERFRRSWLPYYGVMEFDSADLGELERNGTLYSVILHEMGHVLGFGTIWQERGLLAGAGTSNPRFVGSRAVAAYNAVFGVSASAVPVEAGGGPGTRDGHWRESVFRTELMTGWVSPPGTPNPLSRITIAAMADLGYQVNLNAADAYSRPGSSVPTTSGTSSGSAAALLAPASTAPDLIPLLNRLRAVEPQHSGARPARASAPPSAKARPPARAFAPPPQPTWLPPLLLEQPRNSTSDPWDVPAVGWPGLAPAW
jgi:hypothetical protein